MEDPEFRLLTGPDPTEGEVAVRSRFVVREHDGCVDRYMYSDDGVYRWRFDRCWGAGRSLTWVGLNPGTGDRDGTSRPTLRRMERVSREAGYSALSIVNLFGFRASAPRALRSVTDPVGCDNDVVIAATTSAGATDRTVACWGAASEAHWLGRSKHVAGRLIATPMFCLGVTKCGHPRHPLYVAADAALVPWSGR